MPRDVPESVPSKFVIRKLPPELTEESFKTILQNVCQDELEWFRYHPGSSGESGITTSTAFIKLQHPELAPILKQVLQHSPFVGEHGVPYHCEMEVAFFQRVPKERPKGDPYVATYEQDPYYQEFLKEMEKEDEAAKKGPTISATTTIVEQETEAEPIVTPLMSYIINRYKSGPGRSRNGKSTSGDGREKENRKRLPAIPEKPTTHKSAPGESQTPGKSAPIKRGRGSRRDERIKGREGPMDYGDSDLQQESSQTGKPVRGKGAKAPSRSTTNGDASEQPSTSMAVDTSPVIVSSADMAAARTAAQAAARVAMQLAAEADGPLSVVGTDTVGAKNGATSSPAKVTPRKPRPGRRPKGRGVGSGPDRDDGAADVQGGESQTGEVAPSAATDRVIAAAAAAASAALQDSAPGERPKPRTRPALGSRGVRDALSRAGIKQPADSTVSKPKAGRGGAAGARAGDGREGSSGP